MRNERRHAEEQHFIDQQRTDKFKHAAVWFIKRLVLFAILIIYTVIGAYVFEVSRLISSWTVRSYFRGELNKWIYNSGSARPRHTCCTLANSADYIDQGWLGSRVVSALDSGAAGPGFKSQPRRCRVTVLGKLFTPIHQAARVTAGLAESSGSLPPGL